MPEIINLVLIAIILFGTGASLYLFFTFRQYNVQSKQDLESQHYTIPTLIEHVRETINEITRANLFELGLNEVEFKKQANKRAELKKALKQCMHGSLEDKQFVKSIIYDILYSYIPEDKIDEIIPFNNSWLLSPREKFAIILHVYKKEYGFDALSKVIETYKLDELKQTENKELAYFISVEDINNIYENMNLVLNKEDRLEIITQFVYERYKGLGVIDEIRDMNIDGVSAGVSGLTHDFVQTSMKQNEGNRHTKRNYESIWIFYKGKTIRLDFLGFENEKELRRVCQIIYRYNRGGQLSEANGYRINEMKDGSRVLVVRPPFSESWAFFVRKFHIKNLTLEVLVTDKNAILPISLIKFLAKGGMVTAITGQQGCGKTTLLMAMVGHIYASLNLRIQEVAFELNLRHLYPDRNILTFRETENITGQEGLDVQKKTDGSVNILGEVATDPVAAWMIQMAQVASLFTLFTHHAKTSKDLIYSLRNSLLKCEMFNNERIAEQQVVSVLDFDIHLARDYRGKRYIERITEIVEVEDEPYPDHYKTKNGISGKAEAFIDTTGEYFRRMTDRKTFETRNIIEYRNGEYVAVSPISRTKIREMKSRMTTEDSIAFDRFLNEYFKVVT
ncbi:MAG: Flp pilus assembly complex ATPase component TadA [Clostridiaceae bacterium]|nr:Flp pilus assembly complex ATPase component TadA [Clostridiaceae bacterium]